MKWYRRNSNLQIEVWQDDFRAHSNCDILLLDLNKDSVLNPISELQEHEGNQNMYGGTTLCLSLFSHHKDNTSICVLSLGPSWDFCFELVA